MSQLEAWEMVLVDADFLSTTHGKLACDDCHRGNPQATDKTNAHSGLIAYPSSDFETFCEKCHSGASEHFASSLHKTQEGYYTLFEKRAGFDLRTDQALQFEFDKECGKCHATCGQCHVSRPVSVNGGFVKGHMFRATPNMNDNCTACHGSRVGEEYSGSREGFKADVHWLPNAKRCEFCHTGTEMHGTGTIHEDRYASSNTEMPRCEDCHSTKIVDNTTVALDTINFYHKIHWANAVQDPSKSHLQCQVCHSQAYKNCNSCHTGGAGITGSSYIRFKIGKNYNQLDRSDRYPYDYVVVRHIPISRDTYAAWGVTDLPNYDDVPTWKMATPHNIQRWTPQTDTTGVFTCYQNCHDSQYYLQTSDVDPDEMNANQSVIIN